MEEKSKLKIEIKFENLKPDFESNIYTATQERAVTNKKYYGYRRSEDYVIIYDDDIPNGQRMINLNYFETYEIKE